MLDDALRPVATGAVGELWIGGGNVGLGYYGNAEETARRFQQEPRQSAYRSIFYRSGDLVREDEFGALWFQGRKDNQIKIAGHRVELEEIDLAAEAIPGVRRSLTVLANRAGAPELVTAFEADRRIAASDLAAHLKDRLPVYMRPTRLLQLEALPTNANGKVDRLAVQRLAETAIAQPASPPSGDTGSCVRRAWVNALGHDGFSDDDSFFDLGGTSLALTRVHAELSAQFPSALSVTDLFEHPTVARIAAHLDGGPTSAESSKDAVATRGQRQQAMLARLRERGAGSRS